MDLYSIEYLAGAAPNLLPQKLVSMQANVGKILVDCSNLSFVGCQQLQSFKHIITEKRGENNNIGLIQLNRPKAMNSLCDELMSEMVQGLDAFEEDKDIAVIILTGSERAFAGFKLLMLILNILSPNNYRK